MYQPYKNIMQVTNLIIILCSIILLFHIYIYIGRYIECFLVIIYHPILTIFIHVCKAPESNDFDWALYNKIVLLLCISLFYKTHKGKNSEVIS